MLKKYLMLSLLIFETSFAQINNPITYPYGGVPNLERFSPHEFKLPPLDFNNNIRFENVEFPDSAKFGNAHFFGTVKFIYTIFNSYADFESSTFYNNCDFNNSNFLESANFSNTIFNQSVNFKSTIFDNKADLVAAKFASGADYQNARFFNEVNFKNAGFAKELNFNNTVFYKAVDFREVVFDDDTNIKLIGTQFRDTIFVGNASSKELQKYDFRWSKFYDKGRQSIPGDTKLKTESKIINYAGTTLILSGPIDLKIQRDKFKHIYLDKNLDYYTKEYIINCLKDLSFKDDKFSKETYMLDYLFEKSTMYQKKSAEPDERASLLKIPVYWLWDKTMNLGFKPFKLILFIIIIFIVSTAAYFICMRSDVNQFIKKEIARKRKKQVSVRPNYFVSCLFFSALNFILFFKIKLMAQTLTYFVGTRKRFIIFTQWFFAVIIYAAFLFFHKSGSIGQGIIDLFVP